MARRVGLLLALLTGAACWAAASSEAGLWLPDRRLTDTASLPDYESLSNAHCVACDTLGNVHVVWYEQVQGTNWDVHYRRYNGAAWSTVTNVTSTGEHSGHPSLAAEPGGIVHLVWDEFTGGREQVMYKRYDGAWSASTQVSASAVTAYMASLALAPGRVLHVVWRDFQTDGNFEISYRKFNGTSWSAVVRLSNDPADSEAPAVAADTTGKVHVVWYDNRNGPFEIYYKCFDGAAWGTEDRLTWGGVGATSPAIAADGTGRVHVAWSDARNGNTEIYYKMFDGLAWGDDQRLTEAAGASSNPSLAVDAAGRIHAAWSDARDGNTEIYYKMFDGFAWSDDQRLTDAAGVSENPSIAAAPGGDLHIVWQDMRDGNYEIYWKNWRAEPVPPPELASLDPGSGFYGEVPLATIRGDRFLERSTAWLANGDVIIPARNLTVFTRDSALVDIDLLAAAPGVYDLVIENIDGQRDTLPSAFVVTFPGWTDTERLTFDAASSLTSKPNAKCLATDGAGNVHVVWYDDRTGSKLVYYKRFDGVDWSADQCISPGLDGSQYPAVAVDGDGCVHAVWQAPYGRYSEIYYARYDGIAWSLPERAAGLSQLCEHPSVACDSANRPHVVYETWHSPGIYPYYIYHRYKDGAAWSANKAVAGGYFDAVLAEISIDGYDKIHVVWCDNRNGNFEIYYRTCTAGTWAPATRLTNDTVESHGASIAVDTANRVHVAWKSGGATYDIYHKMFDGLAWGPVEQVTTGGVSSNPSLAADGAAGVHLVWRRVHYGNDEIYYSRWDSTGWACQRGLTISTGSSHCPSIAADRLGRLFAVWQDNTEGNYEIYFKAWDPGITASVPALGDRADALAITGLWPNPMRDGTSVAFSVPANRRYDLSIYDIAGRLVWRCSGEPGEAGPMRTIWDGRDRSGRRVSPGVYLVRITSGGSADSDKIIVLR